MHREYSGGKGRGKGREASEPRDAECRLSHRRVNGPTSKTFSQVNTQQFVGYLVATLHTYAHFSLNAMLNAHSSPNSVYTFRPDAVCHIEVYGTRECTLYLSSL